MTIHVQHSDRARHIVLQVAAGETIPDCLLIILNREGARCGWIRGSGVVADVELRAYDPVIGSLGAARHIDGSLQALVVEGSIGLSKGELSVSLRALLARESDFGLQTLSGEIESARAVELELFVTILEGLSMQRTTADGAAGWQSAVEASESLARPGGERALSGPPGDRPSTPRAPQAQSPRMGAAAMPARPPRRGADLDAPFPEPGDAVDHFAFGRCDVLKSDGDRLHLKVHKDGRIREIALHMLRVTRQADADDGRRRFKLERRM
jgi:predicted DNA-binding protein with PD1-like motif